MKVMTAFIWKLQVTLPQRAAMTNSFCNRGRDDLHSQYFLQWLVYSPTGAAQRVQQQLWEELMQESGLHRETERTELRGLWESSAPLKEPDKAEQI